MSSWTQSKRLSSLSMLYIYQISKRRRRLVNFMLTKLKFTQAIQDTWIRAQIARRPANSRNTLLVRFIDPSGSYPNTQSVWFVDQRRLLRFLSTPPPYKNSSPSTLRSRVGIIHMSAERTAHPSRAFFSIWVRSACVWDLGEWPSGRVF
jgi:hypothetical protein